MGGCLFSKDTLKYCYYFTIEQYLLPLHLMLFNFYQQEPHFIQIQVFNQNYFFYAYVLLSLKLINYININIICLQNGVNVIPNYSTPNIYLFLIFNLHNIIIITMNISFILLFLAHALAQNQIVINTRNFPSFDKYVKNFNKTYQKAQEYLHRKSVYQNNLQNIIKVSEQVTYNVGVNQFTDYTPEEINRMKNGKIKPPLSTRKPGQHQSINRKVGGPSSLDWRQRGKVTSIKNQGFCGSCWAFATAAYCESSLIINNGYSNQIDLSEQYLLQCTQQSGCRGGFPAYALLQVLNHGIPKQQLFPYNPNQAHTDICSTRKAIKIKGKQVYLYSQLSDLQMIYLLQTSPIIVGVASQGWQIYTGGILNCQPNANVTQDHAVLLVGYTKEYWIIKNQWGPEWGENGFARITRNRNNNCLMGVQVDIMFSPTFNFTLFLVCLIVIFVSY